MYDPENDVQVLPVTVSGKDDDIARMMILIQGKHDTASTIMANLMAYVEEMHKLASDVEAQKAANGDIVGTDGKPLEDEPRIELLPGTNR